MESDNLEEPSVIYKTISKVDLKEIRREVMDQIHVPQDRDRCSP
jgi:hypothetical protein